MTFPLPGANWSYLHSLTRKASTDPAGFTLVDGTPDIISWTPPDDGQLHIVTVAFQMDVTSDTTGGRIDALFTLPDGGSPQGVVITNAQAGTGFNYNNYLAYFPMLIRAGSTFTIRQATALTGGAATLWAIILGL
jgi:hypothetical protein